tara:strand:- start:1959 stop:2210 length:252 start_codon:yes stop_codon:yes gene_type:complete
MGSDPFEKLLQCGSVKSLMFLLSTERVWAHSAATLIRRAQIEPVSGDHALYSVSIRGLNGVGVWFCKGSHNPTRIEPHFHRSF